MNWSWFFIGLLALSLVVGSPPAQIPPSLKPRMPNWRMEIVSTHPQQMTPQKILFYEPIVEGGERLVKEVVYFENGKIQRETDLIQVPENENAEKLKAVPHGIWVEFFPEGQIASVAFYQKGELHGDCRSYYPNGTVREETHFVNGKCDGPAKAYFETGKLQGEGFYRAGLLEGECIQYHENENKAASVPYKEGRVEGIAQEWFPSGVLKSKRQYAAGLLHGNGKDPAIVVYDEKRNVVEVVDFYQGQMAGLHVRYYPNGKEAYRVSYKNGKKEGQERFFSEAGTLIGEGEYQEGSPMGKHWRHHPTTGSITYLAEYDAKGILQDPIVENDEKGQKLRQYGRSGEQPDGPYLEWYPEGVLHVEYCYAQGKFQGEQKEYYPSGQIKVCSHYAEGEKEGPHEEWHENGVLARRAHFAKGQKEGQFGEWCANGTPKLDAFFQGDQPEGIQSEWFENGKIKARAEWAAGEKQGWQREWDEEGTLLAEVFYCDGKIQGDAITWWEKDRVRTHFRFIDGKREGKQEWYHRNGNPERLAHYQNDLLDGEVKSWYVDGALQLAQNYAQGKPVQEHCSYYPAKDGKNQLAQLFYYDDAGELHGKQVAYFPNGTLQASMEYAHGHPEGWKRAWDSQGRPLEEAYYIHGKLEGRFFQRDGEGREVVYHFADNFKNGLHEVFYPPNESGERTKAFEALFRNDVLEGLAIEYHPSGKKIIETPFIGGKKEGTARFFSSEGNLTTTIEYRGDLKNGLTCQYFPNGKLWKETPFVKGLREGEEKTYHETGLVASLDPYANDLLEGLCQSWNAQGVLVFEGEYHEGLRHGKFNKFYDDGAPLLEQTFVYDLLQGEKRKFDREGRVTVTYFNEGKPVPKF